MLDNLQVKSASTKTSTSTHSPFREVRVVQYSQIDSIGVSGDKKGLHWYQWQGTGQFQWSIGTNGTIGTNRKAPYFNGSISEYASH